MAMALFAAYQIIQHRLQGIVPDKHATPQLALRGVSNSAQSSPKFNRAIRLGKSRAASWPAFRRRRSGRSRCALVSDVARTIESDKTGLNRSRPSRCGRDCIRSNRMSGYRSRMVRARCARVSSWRRIWRSFDAQWQGAQGGRAERPLASAVQRVCVQPLLVLQESAQGQGDLPVLIAFRPRPDRPGMKEDVAPKRFEIVHPVKRFGSWNAVGRRHVVSPFSRWESYRTLRHRWRSMADGDADHAAVHYRLAGQYCSVMKLSGIIL
jgi:hypothetical protein